MSDDPYPFKVGDVVYAEGASALLGDVLDVNDDESLVTVRWRPTVTTEQNLDLRLKDVS